MTSTTHRFLWAAVAAGALFATTAAANPKLLDVLAEGKAQTDLGQFDRATQAFQSVIDAADATPGQKAEALIRLGAARRGAGDHAGAVKAFERASKAPGLDRDLKRTLVLAIGGAVPGPQRWDRVWADVRFSADRSDPKRPVLAVVWPDVSTTKSYKGEPVAMDLKDSKLQDFFRQLADISGLNVVINPGVSGEVTYHSDKEPWDRALDQILSANGLAYRWEGNVLRVAQPAHLGDSRAPYSGKPLDLWYQDRDLREALAELATTGGAIVDIAPEIKGRVTIKLSEVPWDQAFDVIIRSNGLDWSRDGNALKVFRKPKP
jgi:hypothetical protein